MARLRARLDARDKDPSKRRHAPILDLCMGPTDAPGEYTAEELEALWLLYRDQIMSGPQGRQSGRRPWGWWQFDAGEPQSAWDGTEERYGDETVRLAQLGELTVEEVAALREEANEARLRIGTDAEHIAGGWRTTPGAVSMDACAVELWERVEAALEAGLAREG